MSCLLALDRVAVGYSNRIVVSGVTLRVEPGQLVGILGGNGTGKSTVLRAVYGRSTLFSGSIRINGVERTPRPTHSFAAAGVGILSQGEAVFPSLTVCENLLIGMRSPRGVLDPRVAGLCEVFPEIEPLLAKTAGVLSGGERQLVGTCRALAGDPRLLLLDEPGAGFSPALLARFLGQISALARHRQIGILMVEQHVAAVLEVLDRVVVLRDGKQVFEGPAKDVDGPAAVALLLGEAH